jgi:hypothetical protein
MFLIATWLYGGFPDEGCFGCEVGGGLARVWVRAEFVS